MCTFAVWRKNSPRIIVNRVGFKITHLAVFRLVFGPKKGFKKAQMTHFGAAKVYISRNFEECVHFKSEMCTFETRFFTEMYHLGFGLSFYRCFPAGEGVQFKTQSVHFET